MTGDHLFVISATCPLLSCFDVSDCHKPFSIMCFAFCSDNCLAWGQPVSCTSCDFLYVQWRKRDLAETFLVVIISSWPRRQKRSKTERILCSFEGSCLVSILSRHVRFPKEEHTNNHRERNSRVRKKKNLKFWKFLVTRHTIVMIIIIIIVWSVPLWNSSPPD